MTDIAYCTRTDVQDALAQADTFRTNTRIDAAIRAAARQVEAACRRRFYPITTTIYPEYRWVTGPVLWLDHIDREMLSVSSFVVDGVTFTEGTDFYLRPDVAPYTSLRIMNTSDAAFSSTDRAMLLSGEQGGSNTTRPAGALDGSVTANATTLTVSDSSLVGVGDLLTIGSERINVIGQTGTDVTTITADVAASAATRSVTVADGTLLNDGERIQIGAERMFVESIAGNVLTVRRAESGSILAAHANGAEVQAGRIFTVERGVTGTTAASHDDQSTILANRPPALVRECSLAYALVDLTQAQAAYGRVVGSGDNQRESSGRGLAQIVEDLMSAHGRMLYGAA